MDTLLSQHTDTPSRRGRGRRRQATFARIYATAAELVTGTQILDLGSCFGFLPFLLAARNPQWHIVGSDLVPGSAALAAAMSRRLSLGVRFVDAARLAFRDRGFDTVLAVHLLEHVDPDTGRKIIREMTRVARRRVVVAVPYEETPSVEYGHVRVFTPRALAELAPPGPWRARLAEADGGWLVLDRVEPQPPEGAFLTGWAGQPAGIHGAERARRSSGKPAGQRLVSI